jgi:hypothetical protein
MSVSTGEPAILHGQQTSACPSCGAPAEPGQLACVACGRKLSIEYRRPPRWRLAAALLALALVIGAGAAGFALGLVAGDDESGDAPRPAAGASGPPPGRAQPAQPAREPELGGEGRKTPDRPGEPRAQTPPGAPAQPAGAVRRWPKGKDAYTVVLQSLGDRASAVARAKEAIKAGLPAGVLDSDNYSSLSPNFWIVFAGQYESQARAQRASERYASGRFPGAFPQFVNGSGRG